MVLRNIYMRLLPLILYYGGPYQVSNRTYGTHKHLPGIYSTFFTSINNNIWSYQYLLWSPVIVGGLHGEGKEGRRE